MYTFSKLWHRIVLGVIRYILVQINSDQTNVIFELYLD